MEEKISSALVFGTIAMLVFIAVVILFIVFYRNRRKNFIREKMDITASLNRELLHAKIEVQEQTLQHVSNELHDDIGQKLSVVRICINKLEAAKADMAEKEELTGISQMLGEAINDMRNVVNTLNPDTISRFGFIESLNNELNRMSKTGLIKCTLEVNGDTHEIFTPQQELVLFRICQEFIQNSIKHAGCDAIHIDVDSEKDHFTMKLSDNGKGFDTEKSVSNGKGNGLRNMINRTKILGGTLDIQSSQTGTSIYLTLPVN
jgi:two-component system, NarL family, sensor kinase